MIATIGLLSIASIVGFGVFILRGRMRRGPLSKDEVLMRLLDHAMHGSGRPYIRPLLDAYSEQLQRRNEFWTSYGQTLVAALIIIVLTILLVTKSISA